MINTWHNYCKFIIIIFDRQMAWEIFKITNNLNRFPVQFNCRIISHQGSYPIKFKERQIWLTVEVKVDEY
jgi:hypothetical protein